LAKDVSKALFVTVLPLLYALLPFGLRRLWQPPVHNLYNTELIKQEHMRSIPHTAEGQPYDVVVTARFFSYAGIGVAAGYLAFRLFALLDW
jgi:hypothetical protein